MGAITRSLTSKGFSGRVAEAVVCQHRASTRLQYDNKWVTFTHWCNRKGIDPTKATLPQLANFLTYLRDSRKLSGGTIASYVSSIASVRNFEQGARLTKVPEIAAIIKGFKQEDYKTKFCPPKWDLNLVLRTLMGPPFEPLAEATLQHLTWKTCFLLAFATAARVSELHAIDVTQVTFDVGDSGAAHLGLMLDFVAKNQKSIQGRQFTVQSLNRVLGPDDSEDRSLCPVRALREYVQRTKSFRRMRKRLFISCNLDRDTDISKNAVSLWLRSTILLAYEKARLPPPVSARPHEVRALAATMALSSNISITNILKGCFWNSESVFSNFYLRDISVEDTEGLKLLGPLVAAQQVIGE